MLYVFDNSGSAEDDALSSIPLPPLVRDMLQDTDQRPEYYRQVRNIFIYLFIYLLHISNIFTNNYPLPITGQ